MSDCKIISLGKTLVSKKLKCCRNYNKTGLQPGSKPVVQFLMFLSQVKKENLKGNFFNRRKDEKDIQNWQRFASQATLTDRQKDRHNNCHNIMSIQARIAQLVAYRISTGEVPGSNSGKGENF